MNMQIDNEIEHSSACLSLKELDKNHKSVFSFILEYERPPRATNQFQTSLR